jgi:1-deoxyxylulose-5-phosphate synthase
VQYARLGSSGLKVSRIALGMMSYGSQTERRWHLGEDEAEPIVRRAVEAGVTFFDTADTYSDGLTEEITGRLLAKAFGRRHDYVLATKVFCPMGPGPNDRGLSRKHILAGINDSLRRLGTDYVLIYREEEREMIPLCLDQGVGCIPWSPLARGLLAGNRERGGQQRTVRAGTDPLADELYDDDFDVVDVVRAVAAERGLPPAQVALAWLLGKPAVTTPIVGATRLRHLEDAIAAVEVTLSGAEVARLEAPYRPHPILGHH